MKRRLVKTILYRLSASGLGQFVSWFLFGKIEIILAVMVIDGIQMVWYYVYEGLWKGRMRNNG